MEGPSILILVEEAAKFRGKLVTLSSGSTKQIDVKILTGQKLLDLKSWGKHLILVFEKITLRIHFLLFGSYRLDAPREGRTPRLHLKFRKGELFFYSCSIHEIKEPLDDIYDWRTDTIGPKWSESLAVKKLLEAKDTLLCDALLDQEIFSGAGNIIKNEVLFRLRLHPEVKLGKLNHLELKLVARELRLYCLQFYVWKKQYVLRKNWLIYKKKICPVCDTKILLKPTGKLDRRSFICPRCQQKPKRRANTIARVHSVRARLRSCALQLRKLSSSTADQVA